MNDSLMNGNTRKGPPFSLFLALFCVLFVVTFNFTLTIMGSIYIVGDLGGSNYMTTYTIMFFCLGNALGVPLGKPLAGRIGIRGLLMCSLFLLAFFSFTCAKAPTYPFFIASRLMQGIVSGPLYIVVNWLFGLLAPQEKKASFTSIILTILAVGPVIGASWGGWISYDFHWRWLFYFNIPLIFILAAFLNSHLKRYSLPFPKVPFDAVGYFFYAIGVFCLSFVLTTGQEFDWFRSPLLNMLTIIGIPCSIFFILWEFQYPYPIVDLKMLKKPVFSFALITLAILYSSYFGMIILLALWLSLYVNYTPVWVAILIGTMAVAGILPTYIIKKHPTTDCRIPLALAVLFLAISSFHTSIFNVDINFGRIASSRVLAGFGLVLFLPPIFRLCFRSFPQEKTLDVVVLFQIVRSIACGLGAALYIIIWERRQAFYHDRLGSRLTAFSEKTQQFFTDAAEFQITGLRADAQLNYILERESTSLALDDCFFLMGWVCMGLFGLLLFSLLFDKDDFFPEKKAV